MKYSPRLAYISAIRELTLHDALPPYICCLFSHIDATVYVGGLDEKVSEPLLWELFLQAGPVVNTHMPKDRVTGQHQGEYISYMRLFNQASQDGKKIPALT